MILQPLLQLFLVVVFVVQVVCVPLLPFELVQEAVQETGANSPKDIGMVMKAVMPKVKGQADGKRINAVVRALLS